MNIKIGDWVELLNGKQYEVFPRNSFNTNATMFKRYPLWINGFYTSTEGKTQNVLGLNVKRIIKTN